MSYVRSARSDPSPPVCKKIEPQRKQKIREIIQRYSQNNNSINNGHFSCENLVHEYLLDIKMRLALGFECKIIRKPLIRFST